MTVPHLSLLRRRGIPVRPSYRSLRALAERLGVLKNRAEALGVFSHDRELLKCTGCGLLEDVTAEGTLITCRARALGRDTGLRFRKLRGNRFRCPACDSILRTD